MAVLDGSYLQQSIIESAQEGLREALANVRDMAREMAPVRNIFAMPRRRNYRTQTSVSNGSRFVAMNGKAYTMTSSLQARMATDASMRPVAPGGMNARQGLSLQRGSKPTVGPLSSRVTGRTNATSPVIKTKHGFIGGKIRTAGGQDARMLRRVISSGNGEFELFHKEIRVGRNTLSTEDLLNSRGRYEVRSGRARTKNANGEDEIGGTLRDSIRVEGPFTSDRGTYGYVSAYAENSKGLNYAKFMEFGSRHNRPHPFLRPALWQATDHGQLRRAFARGFVNAKITTGEPAGGITITPKVKLTGFDRFATQRFRTSFLGGSE